MIGDDKGLPASIAGLFGAALGLYARRFPFYALLTLLAIGVQYIVDAQVMLDSGLLIGLDVVVGAFLAASVSIGVAFDVAGKEADWSRIMTAASLRWGVVTLISLIALFLQWLFIPYVFLPASDTGYGILLLPFIALGKALSVSAQFVNLGRLMVLSVLLSLPLFAEILLGAYLKSRNIGDLDFWSGVPIDMLTLGPLQAIATLFYIDFLRRAKR